MKLYNYQMLKVKLALLLWIVGFDYNMSKLQRLPHMFKLYGVFGLPGASVLDAISAIAKFASKSSNVKK